MADQSVQRRLAAILAADVVGYSRLMGADEAGTLARLKELRRALFEPETRRHGGRIFKTTGDGALVEFKSALDAVNAAVAIQHALAGREESEPEDRRISLRIGISLGDVMVEGADLYGNGVNVAARMEGLAEPGGVCISGNVHEHVGGAAGLAFDDMGEQQVKNIDRPVRCFRVRLGRPEETDVAEATAAILRRPAVAVLPFANLSGDPEQDYFADGLTEDIITALSLWRSFPVIARNSTFAYKGQAPDVRKVGAELGARYVVEGSVRKAGERVRVTAQLIDAETGHHVWAERYDQKIEDIFDLQDEITTRISASAVPQLDRAERQRRYGDGPPSLDAWDLYQRGMAHIHRMTGEDNAAARALFERAIALDPHYSWAHFGLAFSHHRDIFLDVAEDRDQSLNLTSVSARRAITLDESNPDAHYVMAIAHIWAHRYEDAIAECERTLRLNPSYAAGLFTIGAALIHSGRPAEAVEVLKKGFSLSPQDPNCHVYYGFLASACLNLGDFESAVSHARQALQHKPEYFEAQLIFVSSLGHLGRGQDAQDVVRLWGTVRLRELRNRAMVQVFRNEDDRERYIDGLRKAGVPE